MQFRAPGSGMHWAHSALAVCILTLLCSSLCFMQTIPGVRLSRTRVSNENSNSCCWCLGETSEGFAPQLRQGGSIHRLKPIKHTSCRTQVSKLPGCETSACPRTANSLHTPNLKWPKRRTGIPEHPTLQKSLRDPE